MRAFESRRDETVLNVLYLFFRKEIVDAGFPDKDFLKTKVFENVELLYLRYRKCGFRKLENKCPTWLRRQLTINSACRRFTPDLWVGFTAGGNGQSQHGEQLHQQST